MDKVAKQSRLKPDQKSHLEGKILILKRTDDKYIQFDWLNVKTGGDADLILDEIKSDLKRRIASIDQTLPFKMSTPQFYQEAYQSLFSLIVDYLEELYNYFTDIYFWERLLGNSSYLMILLCTVLFIWLMMMFSSEKTTPVTASANRNKRLLFLNDTLSKI
jgi:hypothetical protein